MLQRDGLGADGNARFGLLRRRPRGCDVLCIQHRFGGGCKSSIAEGGATTTKNDETNEEVDGPQPHMCSCVVIS